MTSRSLCAAAAAFALALSWHAAWGAKAPQSRLSAPEDLVIWGGHIYTGDDSRPTAQAIGVRGGRINFVGSRRALAQAVGPHTQVIDLRGATLFPGFTDAHAHLREIGERELTLNLEGSPSLAAMLERVRKAADAAPPGQTLLGRGWIETHWPEARFPTATDLDGVAPDRPVILERADGHALVANSAALRAAHIDAATPAPFGGQIARGPDGQPNGMLIDAAAALIAPVLPKPTAAFKDQAYRAAFKVYPAYGWTGVHFMSVDYADVPLLESYARHGQLPLRVYNAVTAEDAGQLLANGPRTAADGRVITRTLKFYMDGALGSRGAALFETYADADTTGLIKMKRDETLKVWEAALRRGLQVTTHAIGDRANHMTLDWYEQAFAAVPPSQRGVAQPRWRIEHAQNLIPSDIPRFAQLGVIPSMQPSHAIGDLYFAPKRLGRERLKGAYAWQSLINAGAIIPGGTDAPVERGDPRIEFYAAITRRGLDGFQTQDWHPEQAVSRPTALKMFTLWPAYASFREGELGLIKPGYRADFTVFDTDFMTAPPSAILKARALMTVLDGAVAFRAAGW